MSVPFGERLLERLALLEVGKGLGGWTPRGLDLISPELGPLGILEVGLLCESVTLCPCHAPHLSPPAHTHLLVSYLVTLVHKTSKFRPD